MDDKYMTNDEYRTELQKIFDNVHENYKLRWFYRFIVNKLQIEPAKEDAS